VFSFLRNERSVSPSWSIEVPIMDEIPGDVRTMEELAAYRRIPMSTLHKLACEGNPSSRKIHRHWRFRQGAIDRWFEEPAITSLDQEETADGGATRR
jgi:hypothetical protein